MPPSRAHMKRLQRVRVDVSKAEAPREPKPLPDSVRFFREQLGKLSQVGVHKIDDGKREPVASVQRTLPPPEFRSPSLTPEHKARRIQQLEAEFHRLARYMPREQNGPIFEDWSRRRKRALAKWQEAELAF